jgi:hypothetical protein
MKKKKVSLTVMTMLTDGIFSVVIQNTMDKSFHTSTILLMTGLFYVVSKMFIGEIPREESVRKEVEEKTELHDVLAGAYNSDRYGFVTGKK